MRLAIALLALLVLATPAQADMAPIRGDFRDTVEGAKGAEERGNLRRARELYREAIGLKPGDPAAKAGLERVEAKCRTEAKALIEKAQRLERDGRPDEAVAALVEAMEWADTPGDENGAARAAGFRLAGNTRALPRAAVPPKKATAGELVVGGMMHERRFDAFTARAFYDAALARDAGNLYAAKGRERMHAECLLAAARRIAEAKAYREAADLAHVRSSLAAAKAWAGDPGSAEYREAVALEPIVDPAQKPER